MPAPSSSRAPPFHWCRPGINRARRADHSLAGIAPFSRSFRATRREHQRFGAGRHRRGASQRQVHDTWAGLDRAGSECAAGRRRHILCRQLPGQYDQRQRTRGRFPAIPRRVSRPANASCWTRPGCTGCQPLRRSAAILKPAAFAVRYPACVAPSLGASRPGGTTMRGGKRTWRPRVTSKWGSMADWTAT